MNFTGSSIPGRSFHGVVANVLYSDIFVSKFKLQLHYYIPFRTNALGKVMNFPSPLLWVK